MKVILRQDAEDDLERIFGWIAEDDAMAAVSLAARIRDRIGLLELNGLAHMGRPGTVSGTRELIEHPYIIAYRVDEAHREIAVLAIFRGA